MKSREPRRTIQVTARMKSAEGWQDVAIRNVSAHGMRVSVDLPPKRGTYIEVRRASQVIVARTMWVLGNDCGLRTQDVVDIPALINPEAARAEQVIGEANAERRGSARVEDAANESRRTAQWLQFAAAGAAIIVAAGYAAWTVADVLHRPIAAVTAALGGTPG